jgi:hypothetical protein
VPLSGVGIQLTGNAQIGTFIHGIDPVTFAKALDVIQKGAEQHQQLQADEQPSFQAALHEAQLMCEAGRLEDASHTRSLKPLSRRKASSVHDRKIVGVSDCVFWKKRSIMTLER